MNNMLNGSKKNRRILIAKLGLDGHDKGAKIIINFLKEAGYQVIYSGLHKSPREVANIAVQEDVAALGVSILSGSHVELTTELINELKMLNFVNRILFVGGIIPDHDIEKLLNLGVLAVFPTNSDVNEILKWLEKRLSTTKVC